LRVRALELLRAPASAASVARALGESRQKMTYHLQQLEQAGLIRKVKERRTGGFVEDLYQATAKSLVVSPEVTWGGAARSQALRRQLPLMSLVQLGASLQSDATVLLDRAAFDGAEIPSVSLDGEIAFASEQDRAAFIKEYLAAVQPLLEKHGGRSGDRFRFIAAVYPHAQGGKSRT
jgi:DNA-binding transcriptional ArsR family regulator